MSKPVLHLASASPRRREILTAIGVPHSFAGADIDETPRPGEAAGDLVQRLAFGKARAARARPSREPFILAADTVVSLDGRVFGKPRSREDALHMLACLSGRVHRVETAVVLLADGRELSALSSSEVRFCRIDPDEARAYWETGEPAGKAGAYAIQGRGGMFVESLSGSCSGVMGLPVFETARLLKEAGIGVFFRSPR
jgi:septum formation protein